MSGAAKEGPSTLLEYLQVTTTFFTAKGIDGARLDAELLLAEVLGLTRTQLYTNFERPLARDEVDRFRELVRRRSAREPVAYITGRREFWSIDFEVDRRVLVPRPETELLVEIAVDLLRPRRQPVLRDEDGEADQSAESGEAGEFGGEAASAAMVAEAAPGDEAASAATVAEAAPVRKTMPAAPVDETTRAPRVADIGTGSGAIAVALAKELPAASIVATDKSASALELAPANAARAGVEARIEFRLGDGCAALAGLGPFDVIVSNPPYIRSGEMGGLEPEVREWEPRWALESGVAGMDVTAPLVDEAFDFLVPGGSLLVEVGTQAAEVRACFERRGYEGVSVRRDLAGLDRVVVGRRPGGTK